MGPDDDYHHHHDRMIVAVVGVIPFIHLNGWPDPSVVTFISFASLPIHKFDSNLPIILLLFSWWSTDDTPYETLMMSHAWESWNDQYTEYISRAEGSEEKENSDIFRCDPNKWIKTYVLLSFILSQIRLYHIPISIIFFIISSSLPTVRHQKKQSIQEGQTKWYE